MADDGAEYDDYIVRFDTAAGETTAVGGFAKYKGRLIKKLTADEFSDKNKEYLELAAHYFQSLDRGDTINDVVVKLVRERAAELVLTSPV